MASLGVLALLVVGALIGSSDAQQLPIVLSQQRKRLLQQQQQQLEEPLSQQQSLNQLPQSQSPQLLPQLDTYKSCGTDRECVPNFLCKRIVDGDRLVGLPAEQCGYLEVCCDIKDKRVIQGEPDITTTTAGTTQATTVTTPPSIKSKLDSGTLGCGYRNANGVGFQISNQYNDEAQFGEFPWMVAVLHEQDSRELIYECGGALIAPNVVTTAAQCVQSRPDYQLIVRAGEWDVGSTQETLPHVERRVKEVIMHPEFNNGSLHNGMALLILERPVEWQDNIAPICLPSSNANFDYTQCYATGWGKDTFGSAGQYQVILKKVNLPIVAHDECQTRLRQTRLGKYFELHESFICAGGEKGKDTCRGDGGSPLVCPMIGSKDRYYQIGVVAWGIGCGDDGVPGVYMNVPYFHEWINEQLGSRGIEARYYTA